MSWDILILNLSHEFLSVDDIPKGYKPPPLGDRAGVLDAMRTAAPMADFSDSSWGKISTDSFSVTIGVGSEDPVSGIMLHVRGGDQAVGLVADIIDCLGMRAIDVHTGEFFNRTDAAASLVSWRAWRDQVVGGSSDA